MALTAQSGLGNVDHVVSAADWLALTIGADTVAIRVCRSNLLQVDYQPAGVRNATTPIIGTTNWPAVGAVIETNADPLVIITPEMRVEINRNPCRLILYDATGTNRLLSEQPAEGVFADGVRFDHPLAHDFYGIDGYGVWESSSNGLLRNLGGYAEAGYQGHCGAPLVWSRHGYGLLVDSDGGRFTINNSNLVFDLCSKTNILYYLAVGPPPALLAAVAEVSGRPPIFPKYAMGFANTEWGINQAELTNIVATYRAKQIPLDQYILDFDWKAWGENNYGEWRWHPNNFPGGPGGQLQNLMAASGVKLAGIMKPRIHVNTVQGGYATTNAFWWPGQAAYADYFSGLLVKDVDFALPACRAWYFDHITNAFATGIRGWWNDEADQAGGGGAVFGNWQFLHMQQALYEGQRACSSQRVWSINRNFFLGAQRYAYAMWSGDIDGGFDSMQSQRERMFSAINVGAMRWGMDIGGFNSAELTTPECFARWMQFGAFAPIYRVHGNEDQQRQPWVYGTNAEAVAKAAIELRYQLLPYIYAYERQLHETGVGIARPLFHVFPTDDQAANYSGAWMFGDYLLVAPVLAAGATTQVVYLPAGMWHDYFRGGRLTGGQWTNYPVNSATWRDIPLFIRDGAIIPSQPVMNYVGERIVSNLYLDIFPSADESRFTCYDDDGETYACDDGMYFKQCIAAQNLDRHVSVRLAAPTGHYTPEWQYYICRILCPTATGVYVDGIAVTNRGDCATLAATGAEGWAMGTNRHGPTVWVKVAAGAARQIIVSNNIVATPVINPAGGAFNGATEVALNCATPGAIVRYTTDNSEPNASAPVYTAPFFIWTTATVQARGFLSDASSSRVAAAVFTLDNNLLNNGGFERQGQILNRGLFWYPQDPDRHGDMWGSGLRINWRCHSGQWQGVLRGTWAGAGNSGGFWQEVPATPGRTYRFSAWFWADTTWSAGAHGIKLEFLSGTERGTNYLLAVTNYLGTIGEKWTNKSIQATAPTNATWVRVVVFANSIGANGALQFDDLRLEPLNTLTLTVRSEHSTPAPAVGTYHYESGQTLTSRVPSPITSGGTQWICAGWALAGHEPANGATNTVSLALTNHAVLTWLWTTNAVEPCWLEFSAPEYTVSEAATAAVISVIRTGDSNSTVAVSFSAAAETAIAGADYAATSGVLTLATGVQTGVFTVVVHDDVQYESNETIRLTLSNPTGQALLGGRSNAVLTINDDDPDLGQRTLLIISAHGAADPSAGIYTQNYGVALACHLTNAITLAGTQYVGIGWLGTGAVPANGTELSTPVFLLTNDSTITWLWQTNCHFARNAAANGFVAGATNGWYALGAVVTVTAYPSFNFAFGGWSGDVATGQTNDNPLTLSMDRTRNITAHFTATNAGNLLLNPGFELAGLAETNALYWNRNDPDNHGEAWGSAARVNWRSYSNAWEGVIRGTWAGCGSSGGFWQEAPATPGALYRFAAWLWADDGNPDGPWSAAYQVMKIEFLTGATNGETIIHAVTSGLAGVYQSWQNRSLQATAPTNAAWVRVVIMADGVGSAGALQFDELELKIVPTLNAPIALTAGATNAGSFTARWVASAGATGYELDVATNPLFRPALYASDLFISQYGEGSGNNRYLEIFNGTTQAVDLAAYRIWGIRNGGSWHESELALTGVVAQGGVFVVCNNACTSAAILAQANWIGSNAPPLDFSGDDAVGLARATGGATNLIDAVGQAGTDPGTGWGVAGVADATFDHTLVRLATVTHGNTDWTSCSNEWLVYGPDIFTNLGAHSMAGMGPGDYLPLYAARRVPAVESAAVSGLTAGATYYYRVRATNALSVSPNSATITVTTANAFQITATHGPHGIIIPSGSVWVAAGGATNFTVTADAFYHILQLLTNGQSANLTNSSRVIWVWSNATADSFIHADFAENLASNATPEWWLHFYYGATNYDLAALSDSDGDGHFAWQEYSAGTDPTDADSRLTLTPQEEPAAAGYILTWQANTARVYSIHWATGLTDAAGFHLLTGNIPGAAGLNSYTDHTDRGALPTYYRLKAGLP